jgi:hypothetical protein
MHEATSLFLLEFNSLLTRVVRPLPLEGLIIFLARSGADVRSTSSFSVFTNQSQEAQKKWKVFTQKIMRDLVLIWYI